LGRVREEVRAELDRAREEARASLAQVRQLQHQLVLLTRERQTLVAMQPHLAESELLGILREKDQQIVKLEQQLGEQDTAQQSLRGEIARLEGELGTYAHIVEVKDRSIVKLSNELHEFDLSAKIEQQQSGTPGSNSGAGTSFVFCEKVTVGCQTEPGEKVRESLQDTVTAFLMQNKFLNKEVLELNQLRQQAVDREQKLFLEASRSCYIL